MNRNSNQQISGYVPHAFLVILFIGGLMIVYFFPPFSNSFYPKCIFKHLTHLECPGCGSARSLYSLLHGNIIEAMDYNALFVLLLPVILTGVANSYFSILDRSWNLLNKPILCLILVCIFWIVRNINYYPFSIFHSDK